jgi:hypothetical protein
MVEAKKKKKDLSKDAERETMQWGLGRDVDSVIYRSF